MSEITTKGVGTLPVQDAATEATHVLIEEGGAARRIPAANLAPKVELPEDRLTYTAQELTPEQQAQARANIGAISGEDVPEGIVTTDTTATAHQQLVTDAEGKATWEDRTHYEAYNPVIKEVTVSLAEQNGLYVATLPIESNSIPDYAKCYAVVNGETYFGASFTSAQGFEIHYIGNSSFSGLGGEDTGEPFLIMYNMLIAETEMEMTVSIYEQTLRQLDSKYIKDDVAKYGMVGEVTRIEWDGNTEGLESFSYNSQSFYKVTDRVIPLDYLSGVVVKRSDGESYVNSTYQGEGCYSAGPMIVVTAAGTCTLDTGVAFTVNSTGVYFFKDEIAAGLAWTEYAEFDTRRENSILYLTAQNGKRYKITVDDSGALDATDMETGESAAVGGGGGIVITESYDAVNSKVVYTCNVSNEALMAALETGAPVTLKFVVDEMGIDVMANVICAYKRDDIWVARFMYAVGFNDLEKTVITISSDGIEQYME